jgi:hypothetical protein
MGARNQAGQASGQIKSKPLVEGVGVTGLEQALGSDGMWGLARGNLQQGRAAFAHIGMRVMIAVLLKFVLLGSGEC